MHRICQLAILLFCVSCTGNQPQKASITLEKYFAATEDNSMLAGGVRRIPVQTPNGEYSVWAKRFGNNPTI